MKKTTLCYIEIEDKLLMLHRTKKEQDENKDKYIGLGGHFEEGETAEECMLREVYEESGIKLYDYAYRGVVFFYSDVWTNEEMHLFSAKADCETLPDCDEGELVLLSKEELFSCNLWQGDRIFLKLLLENAPFFCLELHYHGETLVSARLNGTNLSLETGREST